MEESGVSGSGDDGGVDATVGEEAGEIGHRENVAGG